MQKRSIPRILTITVLTLGVYELFWFVQTRNELVSKFGAKIPSGIWAFMFRLIQLAGFIAVVVIALHAIPNSSKNNQQELSNRIKPAAVCYGQYNQSSGCKQQIDSYNASLPLDALDWLVVAFAILLIMIACWVLFMRNWAVAYALAVQKATKRALPASVSVLALGGLVPVLGIVHLQSVFNETRVK